MARESTTIVIFGATGDLTRRKLIRFPSKTLRQRVVWFDSISGDARY